MTPQDDERDLLRRVAAQDQQAFHTLYVRYAPRLAGFLVRRVHQSELVDDVLHEVLLVLWQQAARFDSARRLSTWLLGIARHKAISAVRAARQPPELPPALPPGANQANPEVLMSHQERARTIARALEKLPPEQRLVIELTYYQDCTPQEIAARTGVAVPTVRSRLRLAQRRLASMLAELRETTAQNRQADTRLAPPTAAPCSSDAAVACGAPRTPPRR